jgi:hypothetical protein
MAITSNITFATAENSLDMRLMFPFKTHISQSLFKKIIDIYLQY